MRIADAEGAAGVKRRSYVKNSVSRWQTQRDPGHLTHLVQQARTTDRSPRSPAPAHAQPDAVTQAGRGDAEEICGLRDRRASGLVVLGVNSSLLEETQQMHVDRRRILLATEDPVGSRCDHAMTSRRGEPWTWPTMRLWVVPSAASHLGGSLAFQGRHTPIVTRGSMRLPSREARSRWADMPYIYLSGLTSSSHFTNSCSDESL